MADSSTGFPFEKLPGELRLMVLKHLLHMPGTIELHGKNTLCVEQHTKDETGRITTFRSSRHPPIFGIFSVSKEIRYDAISTYFGGNVFTLRDTHLLAEFLYRIGPEACNAIRELSIGYYAGKLAVKAFKLLDHCGRLRKINFAVRRLQCFPWNTPPIRNGKIVSFFEGPGMEYLFKIRGIEEFNMGPAYFAKHYNDQDEVDKKAFAEALEVIKQPRDNQRPIRLPPRELWRKAPMMTRARASRKE